MRVKMSKQPPLAPTASAVGPCPTVIQIVGPPALEAYPGPSHHPTTPTFRGNANLEMQDVVMEADGVI